MFENLKELLRRRALRKFASTAPTGLLPIGEIHNVSVILNVEDPEFNECKEDIIAFFRSKGIRCDVFFFDFRKLEKNELLLTSIQTTVLRTDLKWYGMPKPDKMTLLVDKPIDLFISLVDKDYFPNVAMAACSPARFKIGRCELGDNLFDMVVSGGDKSVREVFATIKDYLLKIQ